MYLRVHKRFPLLETYNNLHAEYNFFHHRFSLTYIIIVFLIKQVSYEQQTVLGLLKLVTIVLSIIRYVSLVVVCMVHDGCFRIVYVL